MNEASAAGQMFARTRRRKGLSIRELAGTIGGGLSKCDYFVNDRFFF